MQRRRYFARLSGPLLDRVDLQVEVLPVTRLERRAGPGESSAVVAARVAEARARAARRLAGTGWRTNAEVSGRWLRGAGSPIDLRALEVAVDRGTLSLRGADRALRVAWTLADLAGRPRPRCRRGRAGDRAAHAWAGGAVNERRRSGGVERSGRAGRPLAGALVATLGADEALELVARAARGAGAVPVPGLGAQHRVRLVRALEGWAGRWDADAPQRHLDWLARLGGRLVVPDDAEWPPVLDDLGPARPMCLWVRGGDLGALLTRAVAVVGARAASAYGEHVTAGLVAGLADADVTVVSGGAFGIDAVAHRAALAADGGNRRGARRRAGPALPGGQRPAARCHRRAGCPGRARCRRGSAPTRHRFLLRNRLIAAAGAVTVVVEAAWRSGALSTAGHAAELMRPVAAVPGPVTSATLGGMPPAAA